MINKIYYLEAASQNPVGCQYYKTYPTFDVLGTQFDMVRSKTNENLHKRSPILYDTLVEFDLRPLPRVGDT